MKLPVKRQLPPYYLGCLFVVFLLYFYTLGRFFESAPHHWTHSRVLSGVLSVVLFVGGILAVQQIFDRLYPKLAEKRMKNLKIKAPLPLRIAAFIFDLFFSFFAAVPLVTFLFGHQTGNGYSVTGWAGFLPYILVILYFVLMKKFAGGTFGERLFGIRL